MIVLAGAVIAIVGALISWSGGFHTDGSDIFGYIVIAVGIAVILAGGGKSLKS